MGFKAKRSAQAKRDFVASRRESEEKIAPPAGLDLALDWYLVFTGPRREHRAAEGLREAGCDVFLPATRKVIEHRRRVIDIELATFPRYLFAAGLPSRRNDRFLVGPDRKSVLTVRGRPITDIREIDGVAGVISGPNGWARVPSSVIEAVARFQADGEPLPWDRPREPITPGKTVVITSGPFLSFQATVVDVLGLDRAEVLIDLFGRPTPLTMDVRDLDAA